MVITSVVKSPLVVVETVDVVDVGTVVRSDVSVSASVVVDSEGRVVVLTVISFFVTGLMVLVVSVTEDVSGSKYSVVSVIMSPCSVVSVPIVAPVVVSISVE